MNKLIITYEISTPTKTNASSHHLLLTTWFYYAINPHLYLPFSKLTIIPNPLLFVPCLTFVSLKSNPSTPLIIVEETHHECFNSFLFKHFLWCIYLSLIPKDTSTEMSREWETMHSAASGWVSFPNGTLQNVFPVLSLSMQHCTLDEIYAIYLLRNSYFCRNIILLAYWLIDFLMKMIHKL